MVPSKDSRGPLSKESEGTGEEINSRNPYSRNPGLTGTEGRRRNPGSWQSSWGNNKWIEKNSPDSTAEAR